LQAKFPLVHRRRALIFWHAACSGFLQLRFAHALGEDVTISAAINLPGNMAMNATIDKESEHGPGYSYHRQQKLFVVVHARLVAGEVFPASLR
jgi:hypothetical protein